MVNCDVWIVLFWMLMVVNIPLEPFSKHCVKYVYTIGVNVLYTGVNILLYTSLTDITFF